MSTSCPVCICKRSKVPIVYVVEVTQHNVLYLSSPSRAHMHSSSYFTPAGCHCTVGPTTTTQCEQIYIFFLDYVAVAIGTAVVATVIFVVMQIIICKCCQQNLKPPGGAETGASVGERTLVHEQVDGGEVDETGTSAGGEGQVHGKVDGGEGGVAVSEHMYMEVGTRKERKWNIFKLSVNEAYATHSHSCH